MKRQMKDLRTTNVNNSLERTISRVRLKKYLEMADGNLDAAISIYEQNIKISEAMYPVLQGLEICLRNTINLAMEEVFGNNWLTNGTPPFDGGTIREIQITAQKLKSPTNDDIVAALKFSFWVSLIAPRYDATLWRMAIYRGFNSMRGLRRSVIHGRMNALRRFRNRVAHHEPVMNNATQMHDEALEAIRWMCRDTAVWIVSCSRFTTLRDR
jgi:hypothetical protein